jgi:phosphatidylglycerophosphate synthase
MRSSAADRLMPGPAGRVSRSAPSPTEGELWVQDLLCALRDAKFAPAAWVTFLGDSFVRARRRRRQSTRQHRQVLLVGAVGMAIWLAVAVVGERELAAVAAGWWLLVVLMLDWHLGMLERPDGRPLSGIGVANVLSLVRAGLVPLLAVVPATAVAAVLIAAGVTDALDGWLARRFDQVSRLGRWLDGAVDSVLLGVAAVAIARLQLLPLWVALAVGARYFAAWLVIALAYFVRAAAPRRDSVVPGRLPGLVLMSGLVLAALHVSAAMPVVLIGIGGGFVTFALTVARALAPRAQPSEPPPGVRVSSPGTSVRPSGKS